MHAALTAGADANARSAKGKTPIMEVPSAADRLRGPDKAQVDGVLSVANALVEAGADLKARDEMGRTPLHWVMMTFNGSDIELAKLYLQNGAEVDVRAHETNSRGRLMKNRGTTVLHMAVGTNKKGWVELFLTQGADPNGGCRGSGTPLWSASSDGIRRLLIDAGAKEE